MASIGHDGLAAVDGSGLLDAQLQLLAVVLGSPDYHPEEQKQNKFLHFKLRKVKKVSFYLDLILKQKK